MPDSSAQTQPIDPSRCRQGLCVFLSHGVACIRCKHVDQARVAARIAQALENVEPADFWRSLTPARALALLKVAPKVAGPREPVLFQDEPTCRYGYSVGRRMLGVTRNDTDALLVDAAGREDGWCSSMSSSSSGRMLAIDSRGGL